MTPITLSTLHVMATISGSMAGDTGGSLQLKHSTRYASHKWHREAPSGETRLECGVAEAVLKFVLRRFGEGRLERGGGDPRHASSKAGMF